MKKLPIIIALLSPITGHSKIYTNANFKPYIGVNGGINFMDYNLSIDLDDIYYSATLNAGARIGTNFGAEFFFSHSSTNKLERVYELSAANHEIYYMIYGFDIYGYYGLTREFDFFTTFGVANYKLYDKTTFISPFQESSEKLSDNNVSTRLGIGLSYKFPGNHISAILRFNYTPLGNELIQNMSEFSFGMRYTF